MAKQKQEYTFDSGLRKPDRNFKMSKTAKTMIALMKGTQEQRNQYKRMMIQAQLAAEAAKLQPYVELRSPSAKKQNVPA